MNKKELRAQVATAVHACEAKKATDIAILQLDAQASGFTDYFVICSAANPRQIQAIADDVDDRLSAQGLNPTHREGYNQAEWVLLDYIDFVVHIFSESARKFYDLERLWKTAKHVELSDLEKPVRKALAKKTAATKAAKTSSRAAGKKSAAKKSAKKSARARKRS